MSSGTQVVLSGTTATTQAVANFTLVDKATIIKIVVALSISLFAVVATTATISLVVTRTQTYPPGGNEDGAQTWKNSHVDIYVLLNDLVQDGELSSDADTLVIDAILEPPQFGTATVMESTFIRYDPNHGWAGEDVFVYQLSNSKLSAIATVNVTVLNHPPEAFPDVVIVKKNVPIVIPVLANDFDADGDVLSIAYFTQPMDPTGKRIAGGGSATEVDGGILYSPDTDYTGTVTISYGATDGNDTSSTTITIITENNAPVALPDEVIVNRNSPQFIDVIANDYDVNGDPITLIDVSAIGSGFYVAVQSQKAYFLPFFQSDEPTFIFDYSITDGYSTPNGVNSASSYVTVHHVNRPCFANNITVEVPRNSYGFEILSENQLGEVYGDLDPYTTIYLRTVPLDIEGVVLSHQVDIIGITYNGAPESFKENRYTMRFNPPADIEGTFYVTYEISDNAEFLNSVSNVITINVVNTAPTPQPFSVSIPRNKPFRFNPVDESADPNGDLVSLYSVESGSNGNAVMSGGNYVTYTPNFGYLGTDILRYTVTDGILINSSTIIVTIVNTPPIANDDNIDSTPKDLPVTIDALFNDIDEDGDALKITQVEDLAGSQFIGVKEIVIDGNGRYSIRYVPVRNQVYGETFRYYISDGVATTSAFIYVGFTNNAPIAAGESYNITWNSEFTFSPLKNDIDINNDEVFIDPNSFTSTTNGFLELSADFKNFTYTPDNGFVGTDSFEYIATDLMDISSPATVTITVYDTAPVARADSLSVLWDQENVTLSVLGNDSDRDGDEILITSVTNPTYGCAHISSDKKSIVFTSTNILGDSLFEYTITDGLLFSTAQVTVSIYDNAPTLVDDDYSFHFNEKDIELSVLLNDSDADGDILTVISTSNPSKGLLQISNNKIFYQRTQLFLGSDTFTYTVSDGVLTSTATVTITFTDNAPVAKNREGGSIHWRSNGVMITVTTNADDQDGDELSIVSVSQSSFGNSITISGKQVIYVPTTPVVGVDTFTYTITDGILTSTASVSITLTNSAPVANSDNFGQIHWRSASVLDVLANDVDPDGDFITVQAISASPLWGSAVFTNSAVTYILSASTNLETQGTDSGNGVVVLADSFGYTINDGSDGFASASVNVNVFDTKPVAVDDSYPSSIVRMNGPAVVLDVLNYGANKDYDVDSQDSDFLVISDISSVVGGSAIIINSGKQVQFTPAQGFSGTATFKYRVSDGKVRSNFATVSISIISNFPPTCSGTSATVTKSSIRSGASSFGVSNVLNCVDPEGNDLTVTSVSSPTGTSLGTFSFTSSALTFTGLVGTSGVASTKYTVSDGLSAPEFNFQVTVTNNAPVANPDVIQLGRSLNSKTVNLLSNDVDVDGDTLTIVSYIKDVNVPAARINGDTLYWNGLTVTILPTGAVTATRNSTFFGTIVIYYTISDSDLTNPLTSTSSITITVSGGPPVAVDDSFSINIGNGPVVLNVLSNDVDPDGDELSVSAINYDKSNGITPYISGKTIKFTPNQDSCDTIYFNYTVSATDGYDVGYVRVNFTNCKCKPTRRDMSILVLVESSNRFGSIIFRAIKQVVKKLLEPFELRGRGNRDQYNRYSSIRVAVAQFGSSTVKNTTNGFVDSSAAVMKAIDNLVYSSEGCNHHLALNWAKHYSFNYSGIAANVSVEFGYNVIILVTAGDSTVDASSIANYINSLENYRIIVLNVNPNNQNSIVKIKSYAFDPTNGFYPTTSTSLSSSFYSPIVAQACNKEKHDERHEHEWHSRRHHH